MDSNSKKIFNIAIGVNFLACIAYNIYIIISIFFMLIETVNNNFSSKTVTIIVALAFVYFTINLLIYNFLLKPTDSIGFGKYMGIIFIMLGVAVFCGVLIGFPMILMM